MSSGNIYELFGEPFGYVKRRRDGDWEVPYNNSKKLYPTSETVRHFEPLSLDNIGRIAVICITAHGEIPINNDFDYSTNNAVVDNAVVDQLINSSTFNYKKYVDQLITISNAQNGEVCYGSQLLQHSNDNYSNFLHEEYLKYLDSPDFSDKSIFNFLKFVFSETNFEGVKFEQLPPLRRANRWKLARESGLRMRYLENRTINKTYSPVVDEANSNIHVGGFKSIILHGFTLQEMKQIDAKLVELTTLLFESGQISRKQLLEELEPFGITTLYLIDLSCSVYTSKFYSKVYPNSIATLSRLSIKYDENNIGGKKTIKKRRKKRKNIKSFKKRK
jgi:hypothetical protein